MPSQLSQKNERRHDVVVIGGGSAGYAAARTACDAGADVAIVDQGPLGGLCILRGCMPTKTILRSAEIMALMKRAGEFGLTPVSARADLSAIVDRKNRLVQEFADYRIAALRDPRFTLYESRAEFISPHEIRAGALHIRATAFVIATGSRPAEVAIPGLEQAGYLTSDEMLDVRQAPSSLLVLGGGLVAVEFAQFFSRIGTKVIMVQRGATLLSDMDPDVGQALASAFQDEGIEVITGVSFWVLLYCYNHVTPLGLVRFGILQIPQKPFIVVSALFSPIQVSVLPNFIFHKHSNPTAPIPLTINH
jgi:pyruvate/2-oxoglutarate dehydrogenase complex dihydrolipoamide dehydrogenase (E3) component